MNTGHFKLVIVPSKATQVSLMDIDEENNHSKVLLYYEPINELFHRKYGASESSVTDVSVQLSPPILQKQRSCSPEIWNSEQIYEFVRKLGFLEAENLEESEESVRIFQRLNQVCMCMYVCCTCMLSMCMYICTVYRTVRQYCIVGQLLKK